MKLLTTIVGFGMLLLGCAPKDAPDPVTGGDGNNYIEYATPNGFTPMDVPADNRPTLERIALGRDLFFDPILSLDSSVSCGSCHKPEFAFADNAAFSRGVENQQGVRNAPTLANIGYHSSFFIDGGVHRLEQVPIAPLENPIELNLNHTIAVARLKAHPRYAPAFVQAYGEPASLSTLSKALAAFMRNIQSANSKVDAYEQGDLTALSSEELAGRSLFYSDSLSCSKCHQPPLYTSLRFENTGLYLHYEDLGRRRVTVGVLDDGKFKVPTLRNVAETAPYMHNGSINSLEEVLAHYESGGQAHPQKSRLIKGFHLTTNQRQQLISFLTALTDQSFLTNPALKPQ